MIQRINQFMTIYLFLLLGLIVSCCEHPESPVRVNGLPTIYPDYAGVTIPANIAPLNFNALGDDVERVDVVISGSKGGTLHVNGKWADFNVEDWKNLTRQNQGGDLTFTVCMKAKGNWMQYDDFIVHVSDYPLEDFGLTYRRIPPGYEIGGNIGIYQRDIHSFEEKPILQVSAVPGQCMNCHTANRANPSSFYMQLRGEHGGTLIQKNGKQTWLTTKTDSTKLNTSYGYWHPDGDYCAFSINSIHQSFFVGKDRRIEVYDTASDVLVLDTRTNELVLSPLLQTPDWESYPVFSADGKTLYFCSAKACNLPAEYEKVKYNLCSISFDVATGKYGERVDTLIRVADVDKSITYPRPSYDGRWLMYNVTDFGNFPVNHKEADLWLMDLKTGETRPLDEANSDDAENYHSWSSDSHWFVFCSRRENGMYTQLFLASIDDKGKVSKPFLLPQRNPKKFYHELFDSYNCPDFTAVPVEFDVRMAHDMVMSDKRVQVKIR